MSSAQQSLPPLPLPAGVSEAYVDCSASCGLTFHILECNRPPQGKSLPLVLLVHGFPEIAFAWRKIMPAIGTAGYHVVAVDQRGYGRTTGWDSRDYHTVDMSTYRLSQLILDLMSLVNAMGYGHVHCIVGHDFGAVSSAACALVRPDVFRSIVIMSHPFKGPPTLPFGGGRLGESSSSAVDDPKAQDKPPHDPDIHSSLLELSPPRKHYKWYNSTSAAAKDWDNPKQGMLAFLRGYVHLKSAMNPVNKPYPLKGWIASELAKMPHYYIMPAELSMPETIAEDMEDQDARATTSFLSDQDLGVYVSEFQRTGFQGSLNWYRAMTHQDSKSDMAMFSGKKIECPSTFISGEADWGNCQEPGALQGFDKTCSDFRGVTLIPGAGHWPQQEQPDKVQEEILNFLGALK